ncbi:MAG: TonB-dependent receptor, partial [FCB group bacterium]|nr:TonB-dependent receptor [FCB group bacterium]
TINVSMEISKIKGAVIEVYEEKKNIQMDLTASQTTVSQKEMLILPVEDIDGAIALAAGVVKGGNGDMHFRGGRQSEIVYLFDGISLNDPLTGNPNDSNVPMLGVSELAVITGGFSAEYGDAQSGIINVTGSEGSRDFKSTIRYTTSNFISDSFGDGDPEDLRKLEFMVSGPVYQDKATFSLSGDINEDYGRFRNQFQDLINISGKIVFKPSSNVKVHVSGLISESNFQDGYDNEWIQKVSEDRMSEFVPLYVSNYDGTYNELRDWVLDDNEIPEYYGNWWTTDGLQSEDTDGDGHVDIFIEDEPYTDWNKNGQWDAGEWYNDVNGDGVYNIGLNLDMDGDGENDHEDFNDNYILDEEGIFDSWYGNGQLDTEDLNFNGTLDDGEDLNGDGLIQTEDADHNKQLTTYSLFERQPWWKSTSNLITAGVSYTFSQRTYLTFTAARYSTELESNIIEVLNEDINYNGVLDEKEDLNGNGILDPYNAYGTIWGTGDSQDMFHDRNNDDIVDESYWDHDGDGDIDDDDYIDWNDMMASVSEGQKAGGFYTVSSNHPYTYNRDHWHYDKKITDTYKLDFISQFNNANKIHAGGELKVYDLTNHDTPDRYGYAENYNVNPIDFSAFLTNKMEYQGIIVNAGLRMEYFEPVEDHPGDESDPTWSTEDFDDWNGDGINEYYNLALDDAGFYNHNVNELKNPQKSDATFKIAPRLGISHPITDHSMMYFNYGRNYQRPALNYLFRNLGYNMGGGFPIVGNPTLSPEMTTSYEIGVRNEIRKNMILEFKGFYKDIFGLTDTRPVYWTVSDWYSTYYNRDYGNVRGVELIYSVRPPGLLYGQINYTYAIAKGKSSGVGQGYLTTWAGGVIPTWESYLEWDQRHTINADLNMTYMNTLSTLVFNYGSGTRYTRPGQGAEIVENTEVFPYTVNTDFKFNYFMKFGRVRATFYMIVTNLFDRKNIRGVADEEWYHTFRTINERYEDGKITYFEYMNQVDLNKDGKVDKNKKYPEMGSDLDPSVYSDGRRFRIGVTFEF